MNIFKISLSNIKYKPLVTLLNVILFATGVFIILFLLLLRGQFEKHLEKNISDIDLVVGAKGSPLQLILSSVYHIDYPTGNILLESAEEIKKNPLVEKTIPIALGDSYSGFRIVGTEHDYIDLYNGKLDKGNVWENDLEVTIGSKVASKTGLKTGDTFSGVHGFAEEGGHSHDNFVYTVTGIFEPSGTVLDQVILTNVSTVWAVHPQHNQHETHNDECEHTGDEHVHSSDCEHNHDDEPAAHDEHVHTEDCEHATGSQKQITALFVFYRNAMGAVTLPRQINSETNMQAAAPALEINRLYSLTGTSVRSVSIIAYIIIVISALSIFISLINSMRERKYEIALIRVSGGSKQQIFAIMIIEGLITALAGYIIGVIFARGALFVVSLYSESNFNYDLNSLESFSNDAVLLIASLLTGFLAAVIPAVKAMKTDISKTLSE